MIGKGSKKTNYLLKNIVLSAMLLSVFISSVTIAPKQAKAADDDMSDVFPASTNVSEVGTGLPSNIPTTGNAAYRGVDDGGTFYVVSNSSLKIELDTNKISSGNTFVAGNNASFWITINLGGEHQAVADINSNGVIDNDDELGSWHATYSTGNTQSSGMPASEGDSSLDNYGIWLDIGTGTAPQVWMADPNVGSPPVMPTITNTPPVGSTDGSGGFSTRIALDPVINFTQTSQRIPITIGANAGLQPNTQYYATIHLEEVNTPSEATSNFVSFRTGSDVSAANADTTLATTAGETATGTTDNSGLILAAAACEFESPSTWFTGCMVRAFYYLVWVPSSWLLMGAGWLLDSAIIFSVSTKIYSDPTIITMGWKVVRDVSNIFFIFVLIYAAIKMILGDSLTNTKEMIAKIILIAVLINFSLFFTKVVVDSSNILARIFYRQIQITGTAPESITDVNITGVEPKSLSQALADGFNVNKMMSLETVQKMQADGKGDQPGYVFLIIFLSVIVNLVAAWTFFICALLFIGRIVGLWVTMIFSAFAFMSLIFNNHLSFISKISWGDWSKGLVKMSFLAPIFLFFIYIIIAFVNSDFLDGLFLNINNFHWSQFIIAIILQFAILIVLLKQAKKMAEDLAGDIGGSVVSGLKGAGAAVGGFVTGAAVAVATGGIGAIGRMSLGQGGAALAESRTLKNAELKGGVRGWLAKQTLKGSEYLSKASFDPRTTSGFKTAMSGGKDLLGYEIKSGKAQEGGYKGAKAQEEKDRLERFQKLKETRTPEQLRFTDAGNRQLRDEYNKAQEEFKKKQQAYNTERSLASQQEFSDKRFSSPEAERAAKEEFIKQYEKENPRPVAPTPPTYKTVAASDLDKKYREQYEQTLKKWSPATMFQPGTRAGELAAAEKLAGNSETIKKAQENIDRFTVLGKQFNAELKDLTNRIKERDESFKGKTKQEIEDMIGIETLKKSKVLAEQEKEIGRMMQEYKSMPETDPRAQTLAVEISRKTFEKAAKQKELDNLKDIFKLDELERKKTEQIEKNAAKIKKENEKLPWMASEKSKGGEKKEEKKDDKKGDSH